MNIREAIKKVSDKKDLTEKEMSQVFGGIMSGGSTPAQIASFLTALRMKGETVPEITGAARIIRKRALEIKLRGLSRENIIDTCGTGGSGKCTFNFSTAVAFIVAGCGVKVAKHGNRSASGNCGSADILEDLGVRLDVPKEVVENCLSETGICFLYAPVFHSSMKYAVLPRKEIGIRTVFNLLGPLCNPVLPRCQLMAVYDGALTKVIAQVLGNLGLRRAYVVHGEDGIDEVTITGKTLVSELSEGYVRTYNVEPSDFGFKKYSPASISGGNVKDNSRIMKSLLSGKKGAIRDMALMNSAMALMAVGAADDLKEAVESARYSIDSGKAMEKLDLLRKYTN